MQQRIDNLMEFCRFLVQRFVADRGPNSAAALTYTTLFAVVPMMTVTFAMLSAIPAFQGVEKKVWFGIEHGIRGFLVRRGDEQRVYMLTLPPTPEYHALTGHDRMPALIEQDVVVPLEEGGQQAAVGR